MTLSAISASIFFDSSSALVLPFPLCRSWSSFLTLHFFLARLNLLWGFSWPNPLLARSLPSLQSILRQPAREAPHYLPAGNFLTQLLLATLIAPKNQSIWQFRHQVADLGTICHKASQRFLWSWPRPRSSLRYLLNSTTLLASQSPCDGSAYLALLCDESTRLFSAPTRSCIWFVSIPWLVHFERIGSIEVSFIQCRIDLVLSSSNLVHSVERSYRFDLPPSHPVSTVSVSSIPALEKDLGRDSLIGLGCGFHCGKNLSWSIVPLVSWIYSQVIEKVEPEDLLPFLQLRPQKSSGLSRTEGAMAVQAQYPSNVILPDYRNRCSSFPCPSRLFISLRESRRQVTGRE